MQAISAVPWDLELKPSLSIRDGQSQGYVCTEVCKPKPHWAHTLWSCASSRHSMHLDAGTLFPGQKRDKTEELCIY